MLLAVDAVQEQYWLKKKISLNTLLQRWACEGTSAECVARRLWRHVEDRLQLLGQGGPWADAEAPLPHSCSKTRGMGAGRKLKIQRREALWADKDYKKSHLGSEWKKPFAGASHAKGIVLEKM